MSKFETLKIIGGEGPTPKNWKVFLGGKDITNSVKGIQFGAFVNQLIKVELHLMVEIDEIEIIHLRAAS